MFEDYYKCFSADDHIFNGLIHISAIFLSFILNVHILLLIKLHGIFLKFVWNRDCLFYNIVWLSKNHFENSIPSLVNRMAVVQPRVMNMISLQYSTLWYSSSMHFNFIQFGLLFQTSLRPLVMFCISLLHVFVFYNSSLFL